MPIIQTNLQKEYTKFPSALIFNRAKKYRGLLKSKKDIRNLQRMEAGAIGEEKVIHLLQSEGLKHWKIYRNLWLDDDRSFECDILIVTKHSLYTFEIKNLTGHFIYENSSCEINGIKLDYDLIQQARKPYIKLKKIFSRSSLDVPVMGAIIFTSEKNKVTIHSPVSDIEVLQMPDLYEYIQQMKLEERKSTNESLSSRALLRTLEEYEIPDPFLPIPVNAREMKAVKKGIYCDQCKSYQVKITKNYVICDCGLHEPRIEAIVRTVCEYGILNFDKNFTKKDISSFLDEKHSHVYLKSILDQYFKKTSNYRHSFYHNPVESFENIKHQFHFKLPKIYYSSRKNLEIYIIN